jgi:hypothetical protein
VIVDCAGKCGKKVVAKRSGVAYLCKTCWVAYFKVQFKLIQRGQEVTLQVVEPQLHETESVA